MSNAWYSGSKSQHFFIFYQQFLKPCQLSLMAREVKTNADNYPGIIKLMVVEKRTNCKRVWYDILQRRFWECQIIQTNVLWPWSVSSHTLPKSVSLSSDYIRICPAGDCLRTLFDMYIIIINTPWENKDINLFIMELMTHPSKMLLLKAKASCPTKWRSCRKREQKTQQCYENDS